MPESLPQDRRLLLALARAVGPASFHRLLAAFGSPDRVFGASLREWVEACPLQQGEDGFRALMAGPDFAAVAADEEACASLGVRILTLRCADYPAPLREIHVPPPVIHMRGSWRADDARALAVVGTRHPTPYGLRAGREICLPLVERGWTLVSGLARGIDTLAHETALAGGGRTVAVVGTGLDVVYPAENEDLARRIEAGGCVISEFPLGTNPTAFNFPRRNRIISALAWGTLVVEAGTDSGALITAHHAVEQGREVFAVPGTIQNPAARGTLYLLREGAHLAASADDVLAVMEGMGGAVPARRFAREDRPPGRFAGAAATAPEAAAGEAAGAPQQPAPKAPSVPPRRPPRPPDARQELLDLLTSRAQPLEFLARKAAQKSGQAEVDPRSLLTGLLDLELRGKIRRLPGALYRLA